MRNMMVIAVIVLAGALVSVFGGLPLDDVGYEVDASSLARRVPRQTGGGARAGQPGDPTLIAAGDIGDCRARGDSETAALIRQLPGTIATLGDHAYKNGSKQEFADCYDPTWGAAQQRTRPAPGNHEYETRGADGYFSYFGSAAGERGKGYYSYDLGTWHIIVLNSNCEAVGGCNAGDRQIRWLRKDLAANPAKCTLAYWHHARFSSGKHHGSDDTMSAAWDVLYSAGADVVLSAHEHNYERFAPQNPDGKADIKRGIRQFVVGTGGAEAYGFGRSLKTSEVRQTGTQGVLVLTLGRTGYDWEFVPATSRLDLRPFADSGSDQCH